MAYSFDSASSTFGTANPAPMAHTVGTSGVQPCLLVMLTSQDVSAATATYGGDSMGSPVSTVSNQRIWVLTGKTGTHTISIDTPGARWTLGAVSYFGIDQTNPIVTAALESDSGAAGNNQLTVAAEIRQVVISSCSHGATGSAEDAPTTTDADMIVRVQLGAECSGSSCFGLGIAEKPGAASVSMEWDTTSPAGDEHIAFPLRVASAAPGRATRYYENVFVSEERGRPVIIDLETGREVAPEELEWDSWGRGEGPYVPSLRHYNTLVEMPSAFYIESVSASEEGASITSDRLSQLESILSRLTRS